MGLDHNAIRRAYPNVTTINDKTGAFDQNKNPVTLEQSKIDEARTAIDAEYAATQYQRDRTTNGSTTYSSWREQMAMIYDDIIAGKLDATGSFAIHNKAVKDANPKP